jgi:predicted DNA binding protein
MLLDVAKARKELDQKDLLTIERDTALTWGGRAAASYECSLQDSASDHAEAMQCFWEAETYRAEAVEHAAMTEDARFVERITTEIESYRAKARKALVDAGHAWVEGSRTPKAARGQRPPASTPGLGRRAAPDSPAH